MTTAPTPPAGPDPGAEAAEITEEIKEVKAEAAEARAEGDTAEAARLEGRVTTLEGKLDQVLEKVTALVDRPFHAAPAEAPEQTPPAAPAEAPEQTPPAPAAEKKKTGRRASSRWFGDRAGNDE